jgi:acetoin utilization deacetylase AcuC-like enzyme
MRNTGVSLRWWSRRPKFEPEWILVSAGFDPHRRDPGGMEVTEAGFAGMAGFFSSLADQYLEARSLSCSKADDLAALNHSVAAVLEIMQQNSRTMENANAGGDRIDTLVRRILQVREKYR